MLGGEGPFNIERVDNGAGRHNSEWWSQWEVDGVWYMAADRLPGLVWEGPPPFGSRMISSSSDPDLYMARMAELATSESIWHFHAWRECLARLGFRKDGE